MITEDYVSFETAKLLKEKGFNADSGDTSRFYLPNGNGRWKYGHYHDFDIKDRIECPTLQMAMKWLREVYRLHITIFSSSQESWMFRITKQHQNLEDGIYGEDFGTYEEACDAAIKYCLENLI